ncbi:MAG: GTPase HflX [Gemmatimonadota bacterium]
MGAPPSSQPRHVADEHLAELERLTETAGGEVVARLVQRLDSPTPSHYIGKGKVEELGALVQSSSANLVIFDEELSPVQGMNLERAIGTRVMDRSELILDIFATRARSREARMQVELAQLEYLLPRLTRMWSHLSRIRGGIGLRGPGETQLEVDRRLVGRRIADLKQKLEGVARSRETQRKRRQGEFRAALVGYTNAGKSSLLRALSGSDVFIEDRLFATLDPATRAVDLGGGAKALVTDTVGFIRKLPHNLVASFRSTLEEAREADVLLLVVDASHSEWEEQLAVVHEVLEELDLDDRPQVLVFNKIDRLTHAEEEALRERIHALEPTPAVFTSAVEEGGLEVLKSVLLARLRVRQPEVVVEVPAGEGGLLAELHRSGEVQALESDGARVRLTARLPEALVERLRSEGYVVQDEGARTDGADG